MGKLNDLEAGNWKKLERRVYKLEHKATLTNAAIGRDGMEVYDQGTLNISNGTLLVNGTASITGTLTVTGQTALDGPTTVGGSFTTNGNLTVNGPTMLGGITSITGDTTVTGSFDVDGPTSLDGITTITGDTTVTGALDVDGPTTITGQFDVTGPMSTTGTLSVEGVTTLKNDLQITTGGKISAGNVEIEPANGGQINLLNGSIASSVNFGLLINNNIEARVAAPEVVLDGSTTVIGTLGAGDTTVTGDLDVTERANVSGIATFAAAIRNTGITTTGNPANLYVNTSGYFYEVTSSARYKLDVQALELPDALLDVPVVDWVDRGAQETYDRLVDAPRPLGYEDQIAWDNIDLTRIPGALAEDVAAAGGEVFVSYGDDGKPRALAYDRFALARTAVLERRLQKALDRIAELEQR